uniref:L1 protein n=1 Tax=Gallid alphaherpesvirus 2 TaxID=10390 RepID=Q159I9_9ALPH|nr:L1 protein [Gallid alphaherpesvirus 2]
MSTLTNIQARTSRNIWKIPHRRDAYAGVICVKSLLDCNGYPETLFPFCLFTVRHYYVYTGNAAHERANGTRLVRHYKNSLNSRDNLPMASPLCFLYDVALFTRQCHV